MKRKRGKRRIKNRRKVGEEREGCKEESEERSKRRSGRQRIHSFLSPHPSFKKKERKVEERSRKVWKNEEERGMKTKEIRKKNKKNE